MKIKEVPVKEAKFPWGAYEMGSMIEMVLNLEMINYSYLKKMNDIIRNGQLIHLDWHIGEKGE